MLLPALPQSPVATGDDMMAFMCVFVESLLWCGCDGNRLGLPKTLLVWTGCGFVLYWLYFFPTSITSIGGRGASVKICSTGKDGVGVVV